jgi:sarcosine oxidase subunit alpha
VTDETLEVFVNGRSVRAERGMTVACVLIDDAQFGFRRSVLGDSRGPMCGMGVCYECRVTIDGRPHQRGCMAIVADGMRIETAGVSK